MGLKSSAMGRGRQVTAFAGKERTTYDVLLFLHKGGDWALRPTAEDFSPTAPPAVMILSLHNWSMPAPYKSVILVQTQTGAFWNPVQENTPPWYN